MQGRVRYWMNCACAEGRKSKVMWWGLLGLARIWVTHSRLATSIQMMKAMQLGKTIQARTHLYQAVRLALVGAADCLFRT